MRVNSQSNKFWEESIHTKVSYVFSILAVIIQFFIGFRNMDETFGQMCLFLGFVSLCGLLFLDVIHGKPMFPKRFKKPSPNLILRVIIIFIVIAIIQVIFQIIPLSIRDAEYALAVVFAAPAEELFFRGLLLEPFFRMGKSSQTIKITQKKSISIIEIIGILIAGIFFAVYHVNYYGQIRLILMVLVGGWWLSFCYYWYKDITANILAHFLLNIIFIIQSMYMVNL